MKISEKWVVSVDVGGTYCDGIGRKNKTIHSVKILSTGRLRGRVETVIDSRSIKIRHSWALPFPNIISGSYLYVNKIKELIRDFDIITGTLRTYKEFLCNEEDLIEIGIEKEACIFAAHLLTGIPVNKKLKQVELRVGTTKATNTLLERKGAPVVWITNKGFSDLLYIKSQQRPNLFQLNIPEPNLLYFKTITTNARILANGKITSPLTSTELNNILENLPKKKETPIAISLIHSYRFPEFENKLKSFLSKNGYTNISISSELQPTIHLLPRSETAVCNAYISPVMNQFTKSIGAEISKESLLLMTSSGQIVSGDHYFPKDSLFSGPAGGIKAAEYYSKKYRINKLITFDMGGTSTDTARIDSKASLRFKSKIDEFEIATPSFDIETVAAGGGSIIRYQDGRFMVGPGSAGASPGPACYGQGGPFTVTDLNLLMERLVPETFNIPISQGAAEAQFQKLILIAGLTNRVNKQSLLQGIESIANEKMADAIKKISIGQGHDPKLFSLIVFGGAGGLHACGIAEILSIDKIVIPFTAGVFSALGISLAPKENIYVKQINRYWSEFHPFIESEFSQLVPRNRTNDCKETKTIYLRYKGQNNTIPVELKNGANIEKLFYRLYKRKFGISFDQPIEVEKIVLCVTENTNPPRNKRNSKNTATMEGKGRLYWNNLSAGTNIAGPSIIYHQQATVYLKKGWTAIVQQNQDLILRKTSINQKTNKRIKPIELEIFSNRFKSIAEQMGAQLQYSSFSVNVKERLDFSCAILDNKARLIANAPHIPVHLGSLGITARMILKKYALRQGDTIICNHPMFGGSHLPDITLLKAVFDHENKLIGYVVNRAHHAEIGGITPGSMPPSATNLEEEGVIFHPTYLFKAGRSNWKTIKSILSNALFPTRNMQSNMLDIKAGVQALAIGELQLKKLCKAHSTKYVLSQMKKVLDLGSDQINQYLLKNVNKTFQATEFLDDGSKIKVKISIGSNNMVFDFTGTSAPHTGNLNANMAIVHSVIIYVLRILCKKNIPLNEGLMKNIKIISPTSFITPIFSSIDKDCPAVVGGNTEVSQRLTDTLLKALNLAACSQGTMNNLIFGNHNISYYETIGGGVGAGEGFNGRSAIHQHMTNTKITDPEELEFRYPVVLEEFKIRKNSAGKGKYSGGDGISRRIKFLEPMTITILAQHRRERPYGAHGGQAGKTGNDYHITGNKKSKISQYQTILVQKGDSILIETPGGGAWGE
ncbi:MAG: hydantoinase B/oxoprolinase family protein [Saprospiraceae bacterium]